MVEGSVVGLAEVDLEGVGLEVGWAVGWVAVGSAAAERVADWEVGSAVA